MEQIQPEALPGCAAVRVTVGIRIDSLHREHRGMSNDTVCLAEVAARLRMLAVACNLCDRRGRVNTLRLLDIYGNILMPELLEALSADCPRRQAMERGQTVDMCGIHCPELARVF